MKIKYLFYLFILLNIILGLFGTSSVLLTLAMYFLKWWVIKNVILYFFKHHNELKEYLLVLNIFIVGFFLIELSLKYLAKQNLSYTEANGSMFYHSPYQQPYLENFWYNYIEKTKGAYFNTATPNSYEKNEKTEFSFTHYYNSLGLRDEDPKSGGNLFTIISLGDSFTEGVGSPQDSTWPVLLQNKLNNNDLQIINAGISGSDPVEQYFLLEEKLIDFNPNIVLIAINYSDISDIILKGGKERWNGSKLIYNQGPWWEFFYSYSFITRSFVHSFFQLNHMFMSDKDYGLAVQNAKKTLQEIIVKDFLKLSKKHNFKIITILHPIKYELKNNAFELDAMHNYFDNHEEIYSINLFNEYKKLIDKGTLDSDSIYWELDGHHNAKGYELWADIVFKHIQHQVAD